MIPPATPYLADRPLAGVRVVECSSFVAGPSGCMTLAMLGADIVKVDPIEGPADINRWPVSKRTGRSLFWNSLNRGKRSVTVDLRSPEGRELVLALATRPGPDSGVVVDNAVGRPWLTYAELANRRSDMIQVHIQGYNDGRPAVDYTVNPEIGVPGMTGPVGSADPVNHVVPAWDMLTGMTAVTGLLAALRKRDRTGEGAHLSIALADVALSAVASMGWAAEAVEQGDRPRYGNHLYGSFGVDFQTQDHHRVMVVALTVRQWRNLVEVTGTGRVFSALEEAAEVDLSLETDRFRMRETIAAVMRPWFAARSVDEVTRELDDAQVLWSRYRTMSEKVAELLQDPDRSVVTEFEQPGIGTMTTARSPVKLDGEWIDPRPAPTLGQDTDVVLAELLGLTTAEIGSLHARGVVAGVA
ncbi:2-methylfumaryl-CoA isomerase [Aeromicrobium sp. 636]|uniref:CoA transferase n=1 Tax=Aeromicrobium senzhongii TaxID=2663859 RepID=A0A8I0EU39_9ACTN|nr:MULTISPECIES: CoA transferase [Aeromicrobium]MBC9226471.1 CoA transferase [Aeromicrobium senzhongii]MCQ3998575.1 2-methylfumaryl-CoA isomerase [Aeromicrobium sp. 636]